MSVPLLNEDHQALSQVIQIREVADTKPLVLENAEPSLDLVHPKLSSEMYYACSRR
jgi:hypothetical protein